MKAGIIISSIIALLVLVGLSIFTTYQSVHDNAVSWEATLEKKNGETEAVLSRVTVAVQQTAGVVEIYANDVKEVISAAVQGRYGKDGSKAVFQMIQEKNPTVSDKVYLKLADLIGGGQKEVEIVQVQKLEVCAAYKKELGYLVRGAILRFAGFPKADLALECRVISDSATRSAMETGLQQPVKLR